MPQQSFLTLITSLTFLLGATSASFAEYKTRAWIKYCDSAKIEKGLFGNRMEFCLTHYEVLNPKNGLPLYSLAVHAPKDPKYKKHIFVLTPRGVDLQYGIKLKVEGGSSYNLKFKVCKGGTCTATMQASSTLLRDLKSKSAVTLHTRYHRGKNLRYKIPLNGFNRAYVGRSIDPTRYHRARRIHVHKVLQRRINGSW